MTRRAAKVGIIFALAALGGCGGGSSGSGSGSGSGSQPAQTYSLTASISGLNSSGLVLSVNGTSVSVADGVTSQLLASSLASGTHYSVTVATEPTSETCAVASGSGTIDSANVANVVITCSVNTYTVGGTVSGLTAGGLVLLNNGEDATAISANATHFTLKTGVANGSAYDVTVQTDPVGLVCTVIGGSGTVGASDVTGISIACLSNITILHSFAGEPSDGAYPYARLLQARDDTLYGTAQEGGASDGGTVFEINPTTGAESLLHSFGGSLTDGATPYAGLIQGSDGIFYGTTEAGGAYEQCSPGPSCDYNYGTLFAITPSTDAEGLVYSFTGSGGANPYAGVIRASDGNLYGTTQQGGVNGDGTVFKVDLSTGAESMLYSFAGGSSDGAYPYAGLVQASDGNLYGTTQQGGGSGDGTVFKVDLSTGAESILYSFAGGSSDGAYPYAGLVQASDGNLYGTTQQGGVNGDGTVFKIDLSTGAESILYSFAGGSGDGAKPYAGLTQAGDGNLYGTTGAGGARGDGTVFKINPSTGAESVLYSFAGGSGDGAYPYAGLIQGSDGNLYGTTVNGGAKGDGTVFKITLQ